MKGLEVARTKSLIDGIVTDFLAPVLAEEGFTRAGRTFRRRADNGDVLVVGVQRSSGSTGTEAVFYINVALAPLPWMRWMRETADPSKLRDPRCNEGTVSSRVRSPRSGDDAWIVRADDARESGQSAAAATRELVRRYLPLLDRSEFLHRLETEQELPGFCPDVAMRAILYLDAGRIEQARHEIDDICAYQPDSTFVVWARQLLGD
ncbi:DUF4304 domain-containing protein [Catellatospora sp. NPDC049609]|uniref:DUF4304 domain-containing protein n=1 Tax=Catellatospora sp. NPDC049609 TaxID=3155505 RepID=UPI00343E634B